MARIKLVAEATFKAKVAIPVHGGKDELVEFVFRHRKTVELEKWMATIDGRDKVELLMEMLSGWELEDAFDKDGVQTLVDNYAGAFDRIFDKYLSEMTQAKAKN